MNENHKGIFTVGGAVRDIILGLEPEDYDYVAVGLTEKDIPSNWKLVGKDFPVYLNKDGDEIALARTERSTGDRYVDFEVNTTNVSLTQDLERRDLSCNSMALLHDGTIFDPFNGQEDIEKKLLRHTSDAFAEDPIRVLRIARFKAKYPGFKIHKTTKALIYTMRDKLHSLDQQRVWKEVEKALKLPDSDIFFNALFELNVLDIIFPELHDMTTCKEGNQYHMEASVFEHTMMMLRLAKDKSILTKLSILYHDIVKPHLHKTIGCGNGHDNVELIAERISSCIPTKLVPKILMITKNHIKIYKLNEMTTKKQAKFFEQFKRDQLTFKTLLELGEADANGTIISRFVKPDRRSRLDPVLLLKVFSLISTYSPKEWIDNQKTKPSGITIQNHIHHHNINICKKYLNKE